MQKCLKRIITKQINTMNEENCLSESTLDLFCQYDEDVERKAAELEITVDYYLAEFV